MGRPATPFITSDVEPSQRREALCARATQRQSIVNAPNLSFRHLYSMRCKLQSPPELLGPTPSGLRMNFYFLGGELEGERLKGQLRPGGCDRFLLRRDGVALIDVRLTLETHDQALINATHHGIVDLGEHGYEDAMNRKLQRIFRANVVARYETAHPSYSWLNRQQCAGTLEIDRETSQLSYEMFALV